MVLECKSIKKKILDELSYEVLKLDRKPKLVVIQVGDDPASNVYVKQKEKAAFNIGVDFVYKKFCENATNEEVINYIDIVNKDPNVDGILVQMPLPMHLDEHLIQNKICYTKDVDGLTDINIGRLVHNVDCLVPCTPYGIMEIFNYYNISVEAKNVVVVGRSNLVGRPMAELLINNNATVTLCHSKTINLKSITKNADILIVAVGKKGFITKDMIKKGSTVIDVGINRCHDKIYGDVELIDDESFCNITPVPNGVGQMTVACLYKNLIKAYKMKK